MSNKMDDLFRNKLEGFEQTPSSEAWAELEQTLKGGKKSNKPVIWWSIAASIAVVAVASWIILTNQTTLVESNTVANLPEVIEQLPLQAQNEVEPIVNEFISPQLVEENVVVASTPSIAEKVKTKSPEPVLIDIKLEDDVPVLVADNAVVIDQKLIEEIENPVEQLGSDPIEEIGLATDEPIIAKVDIPEPKLDFFETLPVTITYKAADDVKEQKSLKEGIANMWNKAKKIKNGEEELFNIRDAKNNLLAFNFKKNKVKNSK